MLRHGPGQGYVSGAEHKAKKSTLILFINERLVECAPLKRALENTYAATYPKTYCPFIFLVGPCIEHLQSMFQQSCRPEAIPVGGAQDNDRASCMAPAFAASYAFPHATPQSAHKLVPHNTESQT